VDPKNLIGGIQAHAMAHQLVPHHMPFDTRKRGNDGKWWLVIKSGSSQRWSRQ
jgi:hypothetical protein